MALTTSGTLTQEFVDILSGELLLEPDAQYVFEQYAKKQNDIGTMPGMTLLIDRYPFLGGTFTEASRALTEGTAIVTSAPIGVTANQVSLTVKEYSGPYDNDNTRVSPIGVSEFLKKRAKHDVAKIVGDLLRRDKDKFIDTVLMNLLLAVSNATTADGTAEGSITSGKTMGTSTLAEIKYQLETRNVPKFADGYYRLIICPKDESSLLQDAGYREAVRYSKDNLMRGEVAEYLGFKIGKSNNLPTKAVGASSAVTGYQSVAFGPDAIGMGFGMLPEVRKSTNDDFGRQDLVIWLAHAAFGTLDARFVQRTVST